MKKLICAIMATLMLLSATACGRISPDIATTATASASEKYLIDRLGTTDGLILGTAADATAYGIDMSDFRDDGYVIRSEGKETLIFGKTEDGLDRAVRYYVNHCTDDGIINVTYGEGYRVKNITIAGRDISEYSIYLFEGADQCHNIAAAELQKYIALACGITLPIVRQPAEHNIVLERVGEDDPRSAVLYREGFNISVRDDGELYISGGYYRGCLYGVYELLELIGWRFAANGETIGHSPTAEDYYLYEAEHIDLPAGLVNEQTPSFDYRQGRLYAGNNILYYGTDLTIILRENDRIRGEEAYNGYGFARGANHGLLMGPVWGGYFDHIASPEMASGYKQPCFTDEEIIEASIYYYEDYIESRLAMGHRIGEELVQIDIAQVDSTMFCECANCMEKVALDGSNTGPVIYFSNILARYFGEKYPGLYLAFFAYYDTTKPPRVTVPEPNLNCSFCFYVEDDFVHCANHCIDGKECDPASFSTNSLYGEWFEKWCEISEMVTVWYYPGSASYNNLTMNSIDVLREDFAYLAEHGVHGTYTCMLDINRWDSQDALMGYLLDELQWNADMTEEEYRDVVYEYLRLLYGHSSAPYLMEYLDWAESVERDSCFTNYQFSSPVERIDLNAVGTQRNYVLGLLDMALENAESAEFEKAIILFSRPAYFSILVATHSALYIDGTDTERAEYEELYYRFKDIALSTGMAIDASPLTEEDFDIEKNLGFTYKKSYLGYYWWPLPQGFVPPEE